jgi:hypothetical protein
MSNEELYLRHAQRIALQAALEEAAQPKPIILPARMIEPPRSEQPRCAPAPTLH